MSEPQAPKPPWDPRLLLAWAGGGLVFISVVGLMFASMIYDAMSSFPVPGPEPVEPDTGPSTSDVLVFVWIGFVGVAGILSILLSKPWRKKATDGVT
jgi:hypothetical protein